MPNLLKGFAMLVCFMAISNITGQLPAAFQYLSKKDGLSQSSVFTIAQDSTGFMWFGTRDGLNRYDGYEFNVYRHDDAVDGSLVGDDIRTLYVDPLTKNLWIGTLSGLSRYDSGTDRFTNYVYSATDSKSISRNVIRKIYRDQGGRLWVTTSNGINLYNKAADNFTRFYPRPPGASDGLENHVEDIIEDLDGRLLLATRKGCFQLEIRGSDPKDFTMQPWTYGAALSTNHLRTILPAANGNLWFGTVQHGVKYWDRKSGNFITLEHDEKNDRSLSNNNVRTMLLDEEENLWVGTFDGLNFLRNGSKDFVHYPRQKGDGSGDLSNNSIRALFTDRSNGLWVGTYYGGVNHYDENYNNFTNFQYSPHRNSLSKDVVSSFAEDKSGNLWIGTEGGGLNYFNQATRKFTHYVPERGNENSLSGLNLKELLLDGDQLWIGMFRAGLNRMNTVNGTFQRYRNEPDNPNSLSHDNVYGLLRKDRYLWIATYGGGLNVLDLDKQQFHRYRADSDNPDGLNSDQARVIIMTRRGDYYIGTEQGLQRIVLNEKGLPAQFITVLAKEKIYGLQEDSQGNIWVGTFSNGLFRLNPISLELNHYTTEQGLPGNAVFGILETSGGNLWMSTNNGLSKLDQATGVFTNYGLSNGLKNLEYHFNAYAKTVSGELLFGGINGFTRFDPGTISANDYYPPLVFTKLKRNNELVVPGEHKDLLTNSINQTEELTFAYNEANFTIGFAALDYFSPEYNRYAYQLEGLDRDWVYTTGETEVNYAIQRDGDYRFRLKGANSDGTWNPNERQLRIKVLPPNWRSWWAYLIYATLIGLLTYALIRFIRLRHKLQLQSIDKQRQEELMEVKLRFFTNITHEFRTPLTLILGPLRQLLQGEKHTEPVKEQLNLVERNTQRLLNLVNQVLTFRKLVTDHEEMRVAESDIVKFLREVYLSFQETARLRNINYQLVTDVEEQLLWFDADKLEKVFFNLLSNAFKFTPDQGSITLLVSQKAGYFEVQIKDTGSGIEPEFRNEVFKRFYEKSSKTYSTIKSSGIGLAISQQLVKLHHGNIFVADTKADEGAVFVVQLQYGKEHFAGMKLEETNFSWEGKAGEVAAIPSVVEPVKSELPEPDKELPLLLLVEDNSEIRDYLGRIFEREYRIITAENGLLGLQQAHKHLPDLVISDVMMPEMDGITFCTQLKTDLEISHIPVILLTARTADLFKIEGLRTGADDYVTKPFNPDELKLRVKNMIRGRKEAREKFGRILNLDPKEIIVTSADENFLESALQIVEEQMGNTDFKVAAFASGLAVSRSLLFTKIKALTGQTPNTFIKTVRLKRAAQLLATGELNVGEVAYRVGFKDAKYFRKCFVEQFGELPSRYKENS